MVTSQVAQAKPFERVLVKRSSEVNGATNVTYEFTLVLSLPVYKNEFIKISPPSSIVIQSTRD